ncbi:hypothetical protein V8C42DRAFT_84950 [Trichoderma barbatum]
MDGFFWRACCFVFYQLVLSPVAATRPLFFLFVLFFYTLRLRGKSAFCVAKGMMGILGLGFITRCVRGIPGPVFVYLRTFLGI